MKDSELYICSSCKQYKKSNNFPKNKHNKLRDGLSYVCKNCYSTIYNKNRIEKATINKLDYTLKMRLNDSKQRAKKRNIYNDIIIEDLYELWNTQNGKCAISGIDLTVESYNGRVNTNVSIDRIDSTKGYTKSNIQLVCSTINMMKGSLNIDELIFFCENILKQNNKL